MQRPSRRALVLLDNPRGLVPLTAGAAAGARKVWLYHVDSTVAARHGWTVVADPTQADLAVVRVNAPFETLHPQYVFGAMQHEGDLGFHAGQPDYDAITRASAAVPTIVTVYLDRPAVLTPVRDRLRARGGALLANFGVSDAALLDVLTGTGRAEGRLPFELPSSMADVVAQRGDRPDDTAHPLYPAGYRYR